MTLHRSNKADDLQCALDRRHLNIRYWCRILWTDESRFCLTLVDDREDYHPDCMVCTVIWDGGSVMVCGGITFHHKTLFYILQGQFTWVQYMNEILDPHKCPRLQAQRNDNLVFVNDNAPCRLSRQVMQYKQKNGFVSLPWPALFSNLNGRSICGTYLEGVSRPNSLQANPEGPRKGSCWGMRQNNPTKAVETCPINAQEAPDSNGCSRGATQLEKPMQWLTEGSHLIMWHQQLIKTFNNWN